ncbi:acylneuraminate cytidylyltransferase family protein [Acanthopleuribacter pedis]|uniref:Acylneuraminate cytidylyltransferase family protein n=1 Tax=Acanthopleuribacter pedis TaxID=442870 RepID=A0A8J7U2R3_9BACT|nr:acylneuraminate cytidylyltransferase family protein [Acanthopleuribacter pedis]MBO1317999.1 acylneuraminate cytidylyltransferase family protein [Acanthopleuribacter pedis]
MEMVAIIPARGGSKGLPHKNVRDLNGKPLLAWTVEAALGATSVGETYVSTEDDEIAAVARTHGAQVIARPAPLATDAALSRDVVLHALDVLAAAGRVPKWVVLLQPTSPLRTAAHIDACHALLADGTTRSVVSVCDVAHHPLKTLLLNEEGVAQPISQWADLEQPRQQLPAAKRPNGAIYIVDRAAFQAEKRFFLPPLRLFTMGAEQSIDIDTLADLNQAAVDLAD